VNCSVADAASFADSATALAAVTDDIVADIGAILNASAAPRGPR
jgi:hypothetical protein